MSLIWLGLITVVSAIVLVVGSIAFADLICLALGEEFVFSTLFKRRFNWKHHKSNIPSDHTQVFRKTTNTVKFVLGKVEVLKFRASEEDIEALANGGEIEMVVSLGVNEWEGVKSCNAIIDKFEIAASEDCEDEDWMEDF